MGNALTNIVNKNKSRKASSFGVRTGEGLWAKLKFNEHRTNGYLCKVYFEADWRLVC